MTALSPSFIVQCDGGRGISTALTIASIGKPLRLALRAIAKTLPATTPVVVRGNRGLFFRGSHAPFQVFHDALDAFRERLRGGPVGSFAILHFASLVRSSLNAIKHGAKSQCVPNPEHFINNRRVK